MNILRMAFPYALYAKNTVYVVNAKNPYALESRVQMRVDRKTVLERKMQASTWMMKFE